MNFEVDFLELFSYRHQNSLLSAQQQLEMPNHSEARNKRVASRIAPRLYLTCLATASDTIQLADLGITHVLSVIEDAPIFPSTLPLRTLHVSVSDYADEDILTHLSATTSFIRSALAESPSNRVLVSTGPCHAATLDLVLTTAN